MTISKIVLAIFALLLAEPTAFAAGHILKPAGKIGVAWDESKPAWMSFIAFSPDGKMVASDGPATPEDVSGALTLWTFPGGRFVGRLSARPIALSPDWKYFATGADVRTLDSDQPIPSTVEKSPANYAFVPRRQLVAVAPLTHSGGAAIRILELPGGRHAGAFGFAAPLSLAISPNGERLAAGHWDSVALWNIATQKRIGMLRGFGRYVDSIAFSPRGTLLAAGTDLGTLQFWDVRRRKRLHTVHIDGLDVSQPAFSPDGKLVAVGVYGTGTVWLIDVRSGKIVDHAKISDIGCGSVAFSPDGRFLIAPSTGGLVTWPYDQGGTIRVFRVTSHGRG